MKRKKLVTLLFTIFASACMALTGCSTEEVVSEEPVISEQSSNEEEMTEEISEEVATEEISEEVESVEKPSEEANLDVVIEASPELQASKDEMIPLGVETAMEFGTITRLGNNKDYPNALEDYEICFEGQLFQISLPKDMCAEFEWDIEKKILKIFDENKTKIYFLSFSQNPMPYTDTKTYTSTEDMNNLLNSWGYTTIDGATVVDLENNEIALSQRIPVGLENYMGEFMYYQVYSNEPYETTNQNNEVVKVEDVTQFIIFYGDANKTNADEISAYVVESFKPIN